MLFCRPWWLLFDLLISNQSGHSLLRPGINKSFSHSGYFFIFWHHSAEPRGWLHQCENLSGSAAVWEALRPDASLPRSKSHSFPTLALAVVPERTALRLIRYRREQAARYKTTCQRDFISQCHVTAEQFTLLWKNTNSVCFAAHRGKKNLFLIHSGNAACDQKSSVSHSCRDDDAVTLRQQVLNISQFSLPGRQHDQWQRSADAKPLANAA